MAFSRGGGPRAAGRGHLSTINAGDHFLGGKMRKIGLVNELDIVAEASE
jgi:hypothetical protein